ncbi:MAG TPA: extracellular solute-binding protein [Actinomycetota bacterium]|nr:extracellular solute-binding protein [Actinomycetota bacterium]
MSITLLTMGVDLEQATIDDAERAQERPLRQRDAGIVRGYYGNNYANGLARGDLWATMAWSGDVFQLQLDDPDLQFVVPDEGGMLWATPLEIPQGAKHPLDAHAFMDFVYQPEIAAQIAEWVGYITPVPAAQEVVREHARQAKSKAESDYLETLAGSPLVFLPSRCSRSCMTTRFSRRKKSRPGTSCSRRWFQASPPMSWQVAPYASTGQGLDAILSFHSAPVHSAPVPHRTCVLQSHTALNQTLAPFQELPRINPR